MNVHQIPSDSSFLSQLAHGLTERFDNLSALVIIMPDNCACILAREYFASQQLELPNFIPWQDSINSNSQKMLLISLLLKHSKLNFQEILSISDLLVPLLDEMRLHNIPIDSLSSLPYKDLAFHWQKLAKIFKIVANHWQQPKTDIFKTNKEIVAVLPGNFSSAILQKTYLMPKVSQLILIGLDQYLDNSSWEEINLTHPQYNFKKFLNDNKLDRYKIGSWAKVTKNSYAFYSELMRPSSCLGAWQQMDESIIKNDLTYLICKDEAEQSQIIASIIKNNSDLKNIAVITNNSRQMNRIIAELELDLKFYHSLLDFPLTTHLRLVADFCLSPEFDMVKLLALLKSPYCNHLQISEFELQMRGKNIKSLQAIESIYQPVENLIGEFLAKLNNLLALQSQKLVSFKKLLTTHFEVSYSLTSTDLTAQEENQELLTYLPKLLEEAALIGDIEPAHYQDFLISLLAKQPIANKKENIHFLTPQQAQFGDYQLTIFADLNNKFFPQNQEENPFLSLKIRKALNLPSEEEKAGQSAFIFTQILQKKNLFLLRPSKDSGEVTTPTPWLYRLQTIYNMFNINYLAKSSSYIELLISKFNIKSLEKLLPPYPNPPLESRPNKLSITQIEKLLRDPYSIYAEKILKLKKLWPINNEYKMSEFGRFAHLAIQNFVLIKHNTAIANQLELLLDIGKKLLLNYQYAQVEAIWWPKWQKIAESLIEKQIFAADHILSEQRVEKDWQIMDQTFKVWGFIDLIKMDHSHLEVTIIDFKTGTVPSNKDIELGFASQLGLAALLYAKDHSFEEIKLQYVKLTGREPALEIVTLTHDVNQLISQTNQGVKNLFEYFTSNDSFYLSSPRDDFELKFNDYQHLERKLEWK